MIFLNCFFEGWDEDFFGRIVGKWRNDGWEIIERGFFGRGGDLRIFCC